MDTFRYLGHTPGSRFELLNFESQLTDRPPEASSIRLVRQATVYLGMINRYVVDLDNGGALVAVRQNLETSSQDALKQRGNRVRLQWLPGHTFDLTQEEDS